MAPPPVPSRRETGRALVAAVRGDEDTLRCHVDVFGTTRLELAARRHGVEGLLDLALEALGAGTATSRAARLGAAVHHARTLSLLERVGGVLDEAAVPYLVVKGPVLAGYYYERSDLRRYVDLDLLVSPQRFATALEALTSVGYDVDDDEWDTLHDVLAGELRLVGGDEVLDLHWTLVDDSTARDRLILPTGVLLKAARELPLGAVTAPTTGATHTLVHVALHAALSGAARLVWLVDLDRVVRREEPDWDDVVRTARSGGFGAQVGVVLARARHLAHAPVPADVLRALTPPGWREVARVTDLLLPAGTARTDASLARLLVRATRESTPASAAALVRRARARGGPTSPPKGPPADDAPARSRYLAAVQLQQ